MQKDSKYKFNDQNWAVPVCYHKSMTYGVGVNGIYDVGIGIGKKMDTIIYAEYFNSRVGVVVDIIELE